MVRILDGQRLELCVEEKTVVIFEIPGKLVFVIKAFVGKLTSARVSDASCR
jgi:hypothetical protein